MKEGTEMKDSITPGLDIAAFAREHRVRFVRKDRSRLMRVLGWLLGLVGHDFMSWTWTTVGRTVYYPTIIFAGDPERLGFLPASLTEHRSTIEHEFHHVLQFERGWHFYSLAWLLLPLPIGLAYFRWRFERVAYLHHLRHYLPDAPPFVLEVKGVLSEQQLSRIKGFADKATTDARRIPIVKLDDPEVDHMLSMHVDAVVSTLWRVYGFCWPRSWMRRWFMARLAR